MHEDLLPSICEHIINIKTLGRLCQTSKRIADYLLSPSGDKHWIKAGKLICGDEYWSDRVFETSNYMIGEDGNYAQDFGGRYRAKLHIFPWMTQPIQLPIAGMKAYDNLGAQYEVRGTMKFIPSQETITNDELCFEVVVEDTEHVRGGMRTVSMYAREEADEFGGHECVKMERFTHRATTEDEITLLADLKADESFLINHNGDLHAVRIIHRGMFAAMFQRNFLTMDIRFFFTHDRSKQLWSIAMQYCKQNMFETAPAEMWFANLSYNFVEYYGPDVYKKF